MTANNIKLRAKDYGPFETLRRMRNAFRETVRRCHDPKNRQYHYYGGRGITVCAEWRHSFERYVEDMGLRPPGLTLDRVDNDKGYSKDNCRWATRAQQTDNSRNPRFITWWGVRKSVAGWERELGWKSGVLKARLNVLGYSLEDAFAKPVKCGYRLPAGVYKERRKPDMSRTLKGFLNPNTRLGPQERDACESRWRAGESFSALAREHGVTVTTMSSACQRLKAYSENRNPTC